MFSSTRLGTEVQELSNAAGGYHKVVKENRALYNLVQDLKGQLLLLVIAIFGCYVKF